MSGLSVKSFYNKSTPYIPPHLQKKNHSDVECKILILVMQKKRMSKNSMTYRILSHRLKNMKKWVHHMYKKSGDDKTLDGHSKGEWSESSESVDLSDDGVIKKQTMYKRKL